MTKREFRKVQYRAELAAENIYSTRDRSIEYTEKAKRAIAEGNADDAGYWAAESAGWILSRTHPESREWSFGVVIETS